MPDKFCFWLIFSIGIWHKSSSVQGNVLYVSWKNLTVKAIGVFVALVVLSLAFIPYAGGGLYRIGSK